MASYSKVLAIPELLETILLHLPARDLLLAQRTCKSFRDATKTSPLLQRKLFLTQEPLLASGSNCGVKWNPLLKPWFKLLDPFWKANHESDYSAPDFNAFNHPTASWRLMGFSQPALTDVLIYPLFLFGWMCNVDGVKMGQVDDGIGDCNRK